MPLLLPRKVVGILIIVAFLLLPIASAYDVTPTTEYKAKVLTKGETSAKFDNGEVTYNNGNFGVTAHTVVDNTEFKPASEKFDYTGVTWDTGETGPFLISDPELSINYQYKGKILKETITIKKDKKISFAVNLASSSKLIPWYNGQWKIVSATSGDTMAGIVIEKPYGIDANGNRIEMEYTYSDGYLNLVYNRSVVEYPLVDGKFVPVYSEIKYPLAIDPTWVASGSHWVTTDGGYTILMYNTSGTTTLTVPSGVTTMEVASIGAGGGGGNGGNAGGGGGAGGLHNVSSLSVTAGNTITITVGAKGTGGVGPGAQGGDGSSTNVTYSSWAVNATGGGGGGGNPLQTGRDGGSGGGSYVGAAPGSGVPGEGKNGGTGQNAAPNYPAGGGGGNQTVGGNGAIGVIGGAGGNGTLLYIAGIPPMPVCDGGGGGTFGGGVGGIGGRTGGAGGAGTAGSNAALDSGSGGGGGGSPDGVARPAGGDGSDGLVLIRYPTPVVESLVLTPTVSSQYATLASLSIYPSTFEPINWTFNDTYTSQMPNNVTHFYSVAGNYTINASITNITSPFGFRNYTTYLNQTSDTDTYLKSWMHWNGTNGGTVFTDQMGNAWTPTSVTTSTAVVKFGYTSGAFASMLSRLQTPSSSAFNFSTSNFTIEMWVYPTQSNSGDFIISRTTSSTLLNDGWGLYHSTASAASDGWVFFMGSAATGSTGTFTIPLNSWNHVAIQRDGAGNVIVYVNGVQAAQKTGLTGNYDTINPIVYGDPVLGSGNSARMYIDESRISTTTRWLMSGTTVSYSPPYREYRGDLYPIYANPNADTVIRYKTDPAAAEAAVITNVSGRYRTVQIQNVSIANNISVTIAWDPVYQTVTSVIANTSAFTGINFTQIVFNPTAGTIRINATRPGGFNTTGQPNNRASFADVRMLYKTYADPSIATEVNGQTFSRGFLKNSSTGVDWPVDMFILTNVTLLDWVTYSNFSVTQATVGSQTMFLPIDNNFTANRWQWNFGDGTPVITNDTYPEPHYYAAPGYYTVSCNAFLIENSSVSNTTTLLHAANVTYADDYLNPDFYAISTSGSPSFLASFIDTSIIQNTTNVAYNWSFGDNTYSNVVGSTQHVYTASGIYDVNLSITNHYVLGGVESTQTKYLLKSMYITVANQQATTWYTQRLVRITAVTSRGIPIPYANISATFLASSLPNTTVSWIQTAFGVTQSVAQQMTDNALIMSSFSGDDGSVTYMMFPGFKYGIRIRNLTTGLDFYTTLHPNDNDYIIYCPDVPTFSQNQTLSLMQNTSLYVTEPNMSYVTFNIVYQDTSGLTSNVRWNVSRFDNNTNMYYNDLGNPGVLAVTDSYTVPNVRGQEWKFWYNATRGAIA